LRERQVVDLLYLWIEEYTVDESKIADNLLVKLRQPRTYEERAAPIPVIVRYRQGVVRTHAVRQGVRATHVFSLTPTVAASMSRDDVAGLSDESNVEYIWLDEEIHTCLDRSVSAISVPAVWAAGYRGTGIKIGVVDTGIDRTHPDFAGRIVDGASFVSGDYQDDNGHGTHVASICAGSGAAQGGTYKGVAPEARLYVAKALDQGGSGSMSGVMAGVEWAVDRGVQVINLSLGGSGSSDGQDALSLTCNAAVSRGIVVCVAAGNEGPTARTIGSPGAAADVITIGATDRADRVASFSSRGPTRDGRTKPDLCFPGVDIVAARASGTTMGSPLNDRYTVSSGTSMATPHAAGLAALLLQAQAGATPARIKQVLTQTALNVGADPNAQGAGRARAEHALAAIRGDPPPPEPTPQPPTTPGCLLAFLMPFVRR
jgi:serine protease AprX